MAVLGVKEGEWNNHKVYWIAGKSLRLLKIEPFFSSSDNQQIERNHDPQAKTNDCVDVEKGDIHSV